MRWLKRSYRNNSFAMFISVLLRCVSRTRNIAIAITKPLDYVEKERVCGCMREREKERADESSRKREFPQLAVEKSRRIEKPENSLVFRSRESEAGRMRFNDLCRRFSQRHGSTFRVSFRADRRRSALSDHGYGNRYSR